MSSISFKAIVPFWYAFQSHPAVISAAVSALDTHGSGLSSVRFICGTQDIHKVNG